MEDELVGRQALEVVRRQRRANQPMERGGVVVRQAEGQLRARVAQGGVTERLRKLGQVLCGELDGLVPVKRHSFLSELIPYAELKVIEGVGHLPTLEAPEETTRALFSWLKQPLVLRIRADA